MIYVPRGDLLRSATSAVGRRADLFARDEARDLHLIDSPRLAPRGAGAGPCVIFDAGSIERRSG